MKLLGRVIDNEGIWMDSEKVDSVLNDQLEHVSDYLSKDPEMKLYGAVGKFHLADHIDSCFSKWTLNFMKGLDKLMAKLWRLCGLE